MKTEHTPGPWRIGALVHEVHAADGSLVAELASRGEKYRETRHNARLIAAAPDLLEALRWIASCECEDDGDNDYIYSKAREAIAKATGETE